MKGRCVKMLVIFCELVCRVLVFYEILDSVGVCDYVLYDDIVVLSMME